MNNWQNRFNKAVRAAKYIEKGIKEPSEVEAENKRTAELVKHYTVYSIVGAKEKPIAWRLYAADVPNVVAAARRRMIRLHENIVEGDPLYVTTEFEAREEIC